MLHQSNQELDVAFRELRRSLRGYLLRRIPDAFQVEDLLQDIFVKALASQRAGRQVENLTGWLYVTARTVVVDYYRSIGEPAQELDENIPESENDSVQLHQEIASCLRPFIEQLPPIYRDTLIAADLYGKPMRSLAEAQSVSISAIKSRVVRAREMLKERLLKCCHVEMSDGLVNDYHCISTIHCGERSA